MMDYVKSTTLRTLTPEELDHVSGGSDEIVVTGKRKSSDGGSGGGFGGFGRGGTGIGSGGTGGGYGGGGGGILDKIFPPAGDSDKDGIPDSEDKANGFPDKNIEAEMTRPDGSKMVNFGDADDWHLFDKNGKYLGNNYKLADTNHNTGGSFGGGLGKDGGTISISQNGVNYVFIQR